MGGKSMKKIKKMYNKVSNRDKIISLILLILIVIFVIIAVVRFIQQHDYNQLVSDVISLIIILACAIGFLANVLGMANINNMVSEKRKEFLEKEEKLKPEVREKFALKTDEFVEVLYTPEDNSKSLQESVQISQKLGAKYFAKEREGLKAVIVIIKNENGEEIQEPEEVNYIYFNNNYKPKE